MIRGNHRVILVKPPLDNPEAVSKPMIGRLNAGDIHRECCPSAASRQKHQRVIRSREQIRPGNVLNVKIRDDDIARLRTDLNAHR